MAAIVPSVVLPPAIPFTLHVTLAEALPSPETATVKTCSPPVGTLALVGVSTTVTVEGLVVGLVEPVQAD